MTTETKAKIGLVRNNDFLFPFQIKANPWILSFLLICLSGPIASILLPSLYGNNNIWKGIMVIWGIVVYLLSWSYLHENVFSDKERKLKLNSVWINMLSIPYATIAPALYPLAVLGYQVFGYYLTTSIVLTVLILLIAYTILQNAVIFHKQALRETISSWMPSEETLSFVKLLTPVELKISPWSFTFAVFSLSGIVIAWATKWENGVYLLVWCVIEYFYILFNLSGLLDSQGSWEQTYWVWQLAVPYTALVTGIYPYLVFTLGTDTFSPWVLFGSIAVLVYLIVQNYLIYRSSDSRKSKD